VLYDTKQDGSKMCHTALVFLGSRSRANSVISGHVTARGTSQRLGGIIFATREVTYIFVTVLVANLKE